MFGGGISVSKAHGRSGENGKLNRFSLLYKNTLSTTSLILLSCVVIGAFLLNSAAAEIRSVDNKQTNIRVTLIANDLDNQVKLMIEASLRLSTNVLYRPFFRDQSALNEIDLVTDLRKYDNFSQLAESCFLLYKDETSVYKSFAKNNFYVHVNFLGISDDEALNTAISSAREFTALKPESSDRIIFVCPIYFRERNAEEPDAYLCFVSSERRLTERVNDVSGSFDGSWQISFGDGVLIQSGEIPADAKILTAQNESPLSFHLFLNTSQYAYFTLMNAGFALIIAVALLGLAALVTYKNYLPLKRIVEKYPRDSGGDIKNELEYIDELINKSHSQQKSLSERIEKQRLLIAHQLLLAIFKGDIPDPAIVEDIFPFSCFAVITVRFAVPVKSSAVIAAIEALSGGEMTFYCVWLEQQGCFACIAGFENSWRLSESKDLVTAAMELIGRDCSIGSCAVEEMPEGMPGALVRAMSADDTASDRSADVFVANDALDGSLINQITAKIRTGNELAACNYLIRYIDLIFSHDHLSQLLCSELLCQLVRMAADLNSPLDSNRVRLISELSDPAAIYNAVAAIIHELCENIASRRQKNRSELFDSILSYINEHALDYDLDQDKVAAHFGISSNSLYRMFKTVLGDKYMHYLTELRIKKACLYLDEGHTVQDVCSRVGYNNVSHFIKIFNSITGYTPNNYRNKNMKQKG